MGIYFYVLPAENVKRISYTDYNRLLTIHVSSKIKKKSRESSRFIFSNCDIIVFHSSEDTSTKKINVEEFTVNRSTVFYGSVHRDSVLVRSNEMQQYAGIYLLQNYSTCFGCLSHPSSGVHKNVTAASGTGHSVRATTFCKRGLIRPRLRKVIALTL